MDARRRATETTVTRETRADGTGGVVARERWKSFARAREERERGRGRGGGRAGTGTAAARRAAREFETTSAPEVAEDEKEDEDEDGETFVFPETVRRERGEETRGKKKSAREDARRSPRRRSAAACCFFGGSVDEEDAGRTIEELDAIADADRREAALARAPEEVGTTTEDAPRVAAEESERDDGGRTRERLEIERARMIREMDEFASRLRAEDDALRARERALAERESSVVERESELDKKTEDVRRRVAELTAEEKRMMHATQSHRRQDSAATADVGPETRPEGDLSDVGEAGLKTELARVRKTARQFTEKERSMLEQINALRRARDASEARVRQLADDLKETTKDYEMWAKEETLAERRHAAREPPSPAESSPSPRKTTIDDRDLPDWLRSPEPARRVEPASADGTSPTYKKFSPGKLIIPEDASRVVAAETRAESAADDVSAARNAQHPIFSAVRNGRVSEAQDILVHGLDEFNVDQRDSFGNTVLIVAAQNNRKRVTKMSVRAGVPLDARNKQGNTALHYCFGYGYYELGEYLIDKGADDRVVNAAGETPYDGLSADQRRALDAARRALRAARDAKRLHRDDDRRLARTIDAHGGYSDTESIVALTDDDDR